MAIDDYIDCPVWNQSVIYFHLWVHLIPKQLFQCDSDKVLTVLLQMRGVGMCGYYRVPGEPTKEEPEEKKDKKKNAKVDVCNYYNSPFAMNAFYSYLPTNYYPLVVCH